MPNLEFKTCAPGHWEGAYKAFTCTQTPYLMISEQLM